MKNKNLIIVLVVGLVSIILIGIFIFAGKKNTASTTVQQASPEEEIVMMKPEEIGLTLTSSSDNHKIIIKIADTTNISKLGYELSYTKKGDIPTGAIGDPEIKSGKPFMQEIVLGTCSDVCHYDENVTNIKLILKVTKIDGTVARVEETLELE